MISTREIDRYALANDASHYLMIPQGVSKPTNTVEIVNLLESRFKSSKPITFRSGGTSLSGQSITDELLVDTRFGFRSVEVLDQGKRIRVEPGVSVREVNNRLRPLGFKFGPDPASEIACTIGGVIANNSSGMLCGTEANSYQTVESMKLVFSDGSLLDTAADNADEVLRTIQPKIFETIVRIQALLKERTDLQEEIKRQFSRKNTMGYGLNSFIDYASPVEILLHLMVGSEGTLAFIAQATFRTIPIKPFASSGLLIFESLRAANDALTAIISTGAAAIELLDETSLRVAQKDARSIAALTGLAVSKHASLLVEYQDFTDTGLSQSESNALDVLARLPLVNSVELTQKLKTRNELWHIRKNLYASVAANRAKGTIAILEDICVPVHLLSQTCEGLINLFEKYQYQDSVIFGHAKDGNIHFMLNQKFDKAQATNGYRDFTEDMVSLVLDNGGSLKAEHGTGRVMAPFVRRQYGDDLYGLMVLIKQAFDPRNILNPNVIITDDLTIHLKNFKKVPEIEIEVDRCTECGFCEQACPSKNLTLTPRQRIVARRAMAITGIRISRKIEKQFEYDGIQTCAADGMCQVACPVGINTGDLVKRLRNEKKSALKENLGYLIARNWSPILSLLRSGLSLAIIFPKSTIAILQFTRKIAGEESVPLLDARRFTVGEKRIPQPNEHPDVIYLPTCMGEIFGPSNQETFLELCAKANLSVMIPEAISQICCGTPWKSKGLSKGENFHEENLKAISELSRELAIPIVSDNSSCTQGFLSSLKNCKVMDVADFALHYALPRLEISKLKSIVVHPTCSSTKLDENSALLSLTQAIAEEVITPPNWNCCGFAGDRGLLHPELTKSATAPQAAYLLNLSADRYVSSNRMCEIALSTATGKGYVHVLQILNEQSQRIEQR